MPCLLGAARFIPLGHTSGLPQIDPAKCFSPKRLQEALRLLCATAYAENTYNVPGPRGGVGHYMQLNGASAEPAVVCRLEGP